jgi:PadR family transcriptional regulator PadR
VIENLARWSSHSLLATQVADYQRWNPTATVAECVRLTGADGQHHNVEIMLGEFEYLLLSVASRLGEDAYGAAIRTAIEQATGRRCSVGALYTTLDRLETKGLVETWMGDPTPQRGGRPKRRVRVTAAGARLAADFYRAVERASRGASWEAIRIGSRS